MGWFSRSTEPAPATEASRPETVHGKYGPKVRITRFDDAPNELTWQLPVAGELYRLMPGPDRPDYSLMLLERPLLFYPPEGFDLDRVGAERRVEDRQGRRMVEVHALVLTARFVGQQLHPGMAELPVNVAYVLDQSLAQDASVDLAKIAYAAVGLLTEERPDPTDPTPSSAEPATGEPATPEPATPEPASATQGDDLVLEVGRDVAELLRKGIADKRGTEVEQLTATVSIDANRISGLTGNADGAAPEPTPETFERINAALARLAPLPPEHALATLTLHVTGEHVSVESTLRT
jgi:hypothetical protein